MVHGGANVPVPEENITVAYYLNWMIVQEAHFGSKKPIQPRVMILNEIINQASNGRDKI